MSPRVHMVRDCRWHPHHQHSAQSPRWPPARALGLSHGMAAQAQLSQSVSSQCPQRPKGTPFVTRVARAQPAEGCAVAVGRGAGRSGARGGAEHGTEHGSTRGARHLPLPRLRWRQLEVAVGRLRVQRGCSEGAARVQRGCSEGAARVQRGYSEGAARMCRSNCTVQETLQRTT